MSGQLIGGVVGATIGFFFGNPMLGWQIGATLGGALIGEDRPDTFGPRITDLSPQTSEYGRPIPIMYGNVGIGGNVIWAADLIETAHEEEVGGGKGGDSQTHTTYSYSADFAVAFCEGVHEIVKVWAGPDKRLVWTLEDGSGEAGWTLHRYSGTEDQTPNSVMEASLGAGNVPAYRGICYAVFQGYPLENDGNRIPFVFVEFATPAQTLGTIVSDLHQRAGLTTAQLDVTELTDTVDGYLIAKQMPVRDAIDRLRPAFFFDGIESNALVKYRKRGHGIYIEIPEEDLAARLEGEEERDELVAKRQMEQELPRAITVNYISPAVKFEVMSKMARRLTGSSLDETQMDFAISMSDTKAQEVAEVNLHLAWVQRLTYNFYLPKRYAWLEPGDIARIRGKDMRVVQVTQRPKGLLEFAAIRDDSTDYAPDVFVTENERVPEQLRTAQETTLSLL